ncbi:MAG: folate-binding protein YgfZ [Sciscionella sp.]|nr:folate-binding protein YgfZ [Sciscionella sp.]
MMPGAIEAPEDSPDAGVGWHYGDPFAEQRAATRSLVVVDRSHRGVLAVPGDDRLAWLHSLTSQHFSALDDRASTEALVLDAQGRVEQHAIATHLDATIWLDVEPGRADDLLSYLDSMRFWSTVDPRDATAELAVLTLIGPEIGSVLDVPGDPYAVVPLDGGGFARRMPWPGEHAVDLLVPRDRIGQWWRRLTSGGARPAGSWAFEALRVESLRPRLGVDTDERTIPHEVNWVPSAVHLDKGCYRGQETVSKVHNIGRAPRRMVLLHLDGAPEVLPITGDPVLLGERVAGRVGTVARHHELGPIALALLKRSAPVDGEYVAGADDRAVPAKIDPDSVPADTPALGRKAAQRLAH